MHPSLRTVVHGLAACAVIVGGTSALAAPHADGTSYSSGGVTATVTADGASLSDGRIARTWTIGAGGSVLTQSLRGPGQRTWAGQAPDFRLDIDGVPTTSAQGWVLSSVAAEAPPLLPGRTRSGTGAALLFRFALLDPSLPTGIEFDRVVVLHQGAAVIETRSTLVDAGPVALRLASYSLDQVATDPALPAEVQAYNDGSDWRDDYRHVSQPTGAFDAEGEVLRLGADSGVFLVSQRRGGAMSRVARDATGVASVDVDWARDAFDWGPLQDQPPSYNRLENPVYPALIRARVVPPGGTLDLGTSFVGVYAGGAQEAAAAFDDDFAGAVAPAYPRTVGLNTFHPWSHGAGMSDANLRTQVDAAAALGLDTFMLDDQWQGGTDGESGDWRFDPARFPDGNSDGVPDFVDYLHAKGLQLGLWMSPLEFNGASMTYAAHPDWACAPVGDLTAQVPDDAGLGVWDVTNPAFRAYLLGVIDRLTDPTTIGARELKFDFLTWVDCPPHDYADYEDAFVSLVRTMQQQHPDVTFEIDETNDQRSWPFESAAIGPSWFDNGHLHGSTAVAKLLHDVWSAAPWVPTSSIGIGALDGTLTGAYSGVAGVDALMPLALLTHTTFWTDLTTLTPAQRDEATWWNTWFHQQVADLGPVTYELTDADPVDGASWAAWQPWTGDRGYVFAFRQSGGPATMSLPLHGVDRQTSYDVTDVRTGASLGVFSGAQLAAGLDVTLPPFGAQVLAVSPA